MGLFDNFLGMWSGAQIYGDHIYIYIYTYIKYINDCMRLGHYGSPIHPPWWFLPLEWQFVVCVMRDCSLYYVQLLVCVMCRF